MPSHTPPVIAPHGAWESPISSQLVASAQVTLVDVLLDGEDLHWIEGRPQEGGRHVVVRHAADGAHLDLTPAPFNARTRVHEYGGGSALVSEGGVYFSNFRDQRLYRLSINGSVEALTPDAALRYADADIDHARRLWIGVREDHRDAGREAVNTIVALDEDAGGEGIVIVQGGDFYASPRLSPDGRQLAWLTWNHPDMPWVSTQLWVGDFDGSGIANERLVAGGKEESVFQPQWSPDGLLYFASDRSGWWNIHRRDSGGAVVNVCPMAAEFGRAQWGLGMSACAFLSARQMVCAYIERGVGKLGLLQLDSGDLKPFDLPFTEYSSVRASHGKIAFKAGAPDIAASIVVLDAQTGEATTVRKSTALADDAAMHRHFSKPQTIEFPTANGLTAFALYYPPCNADFAAPADELPPLVVKCHGGPTSSASSTLELRTQFWTSRGVAVVDVDYGGSTGYGRAYRERLHGMWGIVDAQDCAAAARYLVERKLADAARTVITGNSAGGFTTLSCLTFADAAVRTMFSAGGSHYGVSDPEALARDTHKFESRYLDWLIAPYADADAGVQAAHRQTYAERSPVRNADRLSAPVAFFQGAEDKIVPPNQTELMVAALRQKGITAQYTLFAGEQHGFRQQANIRWALDAEFYFYSALVFEPRRSPQAG
ncbi:prolyl oligopeptidase family serine peptidase [Variovorax sp. J22R133]|uniref:S9 family peptidase n=1 Tax=Variovorax brevis TaxID=3053503 RepID=UPI0025779B6D|nr:prolyl oligopeptidase family serine peptidase [Variovorax sp. J22R133]MDM0115948.1 prolyl oligopeptidase family serine peptidase [Variovorax sp. J22R133]